LPSWVIVGCSWARKSSSRLKFWARSLLRSAEIAAVRPALSMKWTTSSRRLASWAKIASALVLSSAIVRFWLPRMSRTCLSCWSAGAPERIAAFRFSALPSSAVPNSLMRSWRRSLNGSRRVFCARSGWTVVLLRAAGIGPVSGWGEVPGSQSR
jgi:hypothetical protein